MTSDGLHTYTYDAENRTTGVTDQNVTYQYDPEGMRVATLSGGAVTAEYLYDLNSALVTTVNNAGLLVRAILRANGVHWGDYIGAADAGSGGAKTEFRLVNQVGTLVANGDTQGNFVEGCLSGPFGDGQDCTPNYDYTETHFTDKLRDQESNNDYFGARYFGSTLGRFLSPDPIIMNDLRLLNPQRWNKYTYVINNPLTLTDPTGKDAAYVNFSGMASGFGHSGILSIHPGSGSATYSRFGPMNAGQPAGAGQVQTDHDLPSVQFGANGLPTSASYAALIQAVAQYEKVSPDTVGIDYFKTTDAETTNLDQYIQQKTDASNAGRAPSYCFIGSSCRDYALGGLVAGGAIDAWRTQFMSVVPNTLSQQLSGLADQYLPDATKATVTSSECDSLPDGTQRCQ